MNKKTYYHLVLDRSGSMSSCWNETLNGWSDQHVKIQQLARENPDQEIYVSVCLFDNKIEFPGGIVRAGKDSIPSLEQVAPRGSTALFDAIGSSIEKLEFCAGNEISAGQASVVMVVLTDGYENASSRFNGRMIREQMDRLQATELWNFVFIGADFDITATAGYFNAHSDNQMNVSKNDIGSAFNRVNKSMATYITDKKEGKINKTFFKK
jgi:hypothetical protein